MQNILVTGSSGYIGRHLVAALCAEPGVEKVVGVDIRPPADRPAKLTFLEMDVRVPLDNLLASLAIDTVIHAAFVLRPTHDEAAMEDSNLNGSRYVLTSLASSPVVQLLYLSSATVYGAHPDNQSPLTEASPLRADQGLVYSRNKRQVERLVERFRSRHPEIVVTLLRPSWVIGPGLDNPLAEHLRQRIVPLPAGAAALQFTHVADLVRLVLELLRRRTDGVFNVGGEGSVTLREMVAALGGHSLPLPYPLLWGLNWVAWQLRLSFLTRFPSTALRLFRYPWLVSSRRVCARTAFRYEYTSRQAFADFAAHERGGGATAAFSGDVGR